MKKKILSFLMILTLVFIGNQNVRAEGEVVAKIGNNEYTSLSDAFTAAKSLTSSEVVIQKDITETSVNFTVDAGKTMVFNLNGHTVSEKSSATGSITNNGNLTIKNGTYNNAHGLLKNNSVLVIDNLKATETYSDALSNYGTMTISNSNYTSNNSGALINNHENGVVVLNNTTIVAGNIFTNDGKLTFNGGNYKSTSNLYDDTIGTTTVNSGTFTSTNSASSWKIKKSGSVIVNGGTFNFANDAFNIYDSVSVKLTINGGTFNIAECFVEGNLIGKDTVLFTMNGGTINSTTTDYVLDLIIIKSYIKGGTINALNSKGIVIDYSEFVVGKNDGKITSTTPFINIPKGKIFTDTKANLQFYDGKIISSLSNLKTKTVSLTIPTNSYVKYDKNSDKSYTAYLVAKGNSGSTTTTTITTTTDNKTEDKTTTKNPKTGLNNSYFYMMIIGVVAIALYAVTRKNKLFSK